MKAVDKIMISIANDFSKTPGSRYIKEGPFSGEKLRQDILLSKINSAISERKKVLIDLDGTAGYGTSFLEEAFGGLIRINKLTLNQLKQTLEIKSEEESYLKEDVWEYMQGAENEK